MSRRLADTPPAGVPVLSRQPRRGFQLSRFGLGLAACLLLGLGLRLGVLASPLGELDGDEAVVGLMARHIAYLGDRPVFYYNQHYVGSIEAFSAAPLFLLLGSSTFLLKLVPSLYSLGFLVVTALTTRRLFGPWAGLAAALYLALPPAMLAVWSTKARGGYAELLFLGAVLIHLSLLLAERQRAPILALLWGLVGGLAFWTHLLAVVYLIPALIYFATRRARSLSLLEIATAILGLLVGAAPLIAYNLTNNFATLGAMLAPADLPFNPGEQLLRFFRVGVPVLAGLGQPTTSTQLFDQDWLNRPAGRLPVVLALLVLLAACVLLQWRAVRCLLSRRPDRQSGPALLVLLAATVPLLIAATRFGFFVSEPRYALPLYSAMVPLAAFALSVIRPYARAAALVALIGINLGSLATTDVRMWRPEEAPDSTASTRAELVRYLVGMDRHQMYTDYWIAYPVMFETRETVLAYVVSGGFNRYLPPADNVRRTPDAAWVFVADSPPELEFQARLELLGGTAQVGEVAGYRVYTGVSPPAAATPPL